MVVILLASIKKSKRSCTQDKQLSSEIAFSKKAQKYYDKTKKSNKMGLKIHHVSRGLSSSNFQGVSYLRNKILKIGKIKENKANKNGQKEENL